MNSIESTYYNFLRMGQEDRKCGLQRFKKKRYSLHTELNNCFPPNPLTDKKREQRS